MNTEIEAALATISQDFRDRRVQHCQLTVSDVTDRAIALNGTVLDDATLTAVTTHLQTQFPKLTANTVDIRVLQQPDNPMLTVATNLTGLHGKPGRTSEQWSQLLNGWRVERLLQEDDWCYVRQSDGYLGWAYTPYLAELPAEPTTHLVCAPVGLLRTSPDAKASLVGRVFAGTGVSITATQNEWTHITLAGGKAGWLLQTDLCDKQAMPEDVNTLTQQMVANAQKYMGVPYGWGGITAHGIDCSGLSQLVHGLAGITIPRDADMQFDAGTPTDAPFNPGDLFFFGSDKGHRSISHVGISLGGWEMIHSSGPRNGVYVDDVQAAPWLKESFLGARSFLTE